MVAVVTSGTAGLNTGSSAVLGSSGSFGTSELGRSAERVYVNAATGNLIIQGRDEWLVGPGPDVQALRTYNSQGRHVDDNADNWIMGPARKVWLDKGSINTRESTAIRRDEDGSETLFRWSTTRGHYLSTDGAGAHDTLRYDTATAEWTFQDGSSQQTELYGGPQGQLLSISDADGLVLKLAYNAAGLISSTTTASGEVCFYDYGEHQQLNQIRTLIRPYEGSPAANTQTRVRYSYDEKNRLVAVTVDLSPEDNMVEDGNVFVTRFTYDGHSTRLASMLQTDGAALHFTYDGDKLQTVTDAHGGVTLFSYDTSQRRTTQTDALGGIHTYHYDGHGRLIQADSPAGGNEVSSLRYEYNTNGDVTRVVDGMGRGTRMTHDDHGNVIRQTDAAGNVVHRRYNRANQLVSETMAAKPGADGSALAHHKVYDESSGTRLRFTISAEGRVTEHRYNNQGQHICTLTYAGGFYNVPAQVEQSEAPAGGLSPSEMELAAWAQAQGFGRVQRVDHEYDWRGQLRQSSTYAEVDANGQGQAADVSQYTYDEAGRLTASVNPRGRWTSTTYDGLGRVVSFSDLAGKETTTAYDDARRIVTRQNIHGLVTTSRYDKLGRLVSVQKYSTPVVRDEDGALQPREDAIWKSTNPARELGDSGPQSLHVISGGATLRFRPMQSDAQVVLGLTTQVTGRLTLSSLEWAVFCTADGRLQAYEGGAAAADLGDYNAGDDLRVSHDGNTVRYLRNGVTLRTVEWASDQPLRAASFFPQAPGPWAQAAASNVWFEPHDAVSGPFIAEGGALVDGRSAQKLTRPAGAQVGWNAAVRSRLGHSNGASVSFRPDQTSHALMVGLNTDPHADTHFGSLDWALHADEFGRLKAYQDGVPTADLGAYAAGDQLTVSYDGQAVSYIKNGTVLRRVAATIDKPLFADSSFLHDGGSISDLTFVDGPTLGIVNTQYDALGRIQMTQDATGARQWYVHDSGGRQVGSINALGVLTETVFNLAGQATQTITYAKLVDVELQGQTLPLSLAAIRPAASPADRKSWNLYDKVGHLSKTITPTGAAGAQLGMLTEYGYADTGQLLTTRRYVSAVDTRDWGAFPTLEQARTNASTQDQILRYFHDGDGLLLGSLDSSGSLKEYEYDAAGRLAVTHERRHRAAVNTTDRILSKRTTLNSIRPLDSPLDQKLIHFYNASGQLVGQLDGHGSLTEFLRDGSGNIKEKLRYGTTSSGFSAANTLAEVRAASGNVQSKTTFEYDDYERQSRRQEDPDGLNLETTAWDDIAKHTRYENSAYGGSKLIAFDPRGLTTEVLDYSVGFTPLSNAYTYDFSERRVSSTDAGGTTTSYAYDALGREIARTVDPDGQNLITHRAYDAQGNLARVTDANGQHTRYLYDAANQLAYTVDAEDGLTQNIYNALGQLVQTVRYSQRLAGLQTQDIGNGLIRHDLPDVLPSSAQDITQHFRYDKFNRKVAEIDGEGSVTEFAYDATGQVTHTIQYANACKNLTQGSSATVWRPVVNEADRINHFKYDAASRKVAEINGEGWVTEFVFDALGQLARSIQYVKATSNPWASTSGGSAGWRPEADASDRTTVFKYDAVGRRIAEVNSEGGVIEFSYDHRDGNGLLVKSIRYATAAKHLLHSGADEQAPWRPSASADDRVTESAYNKSGQKFLERNEHGRDTWYHYDKNGHIVRIDQYEKADLSTLNYHQFRIPPPSSTFDRTTRFKYDSVGRKVAEINSAGAVTEFVYNAAGQITRSIQYEDAAGAEPHGGDSEPIHWRPATSTGDRITHIQYDAAGRKIAEIDGEGSVKEFFHNTSGQVIQTRQYANATRLPAGGSDFGVANWRPQPSQQDRVHHFRYDKAGRLIADIDGTGTVTEFSFNSAGQVIRTLRYATSAPQAADGSIDLQDWRPVQSTSDRATYTKYDEAGLKLAEIDGEGSVTEFAHDGFGQLIRTVRYATPVASLASRLSGDAARWRPASHAADRASHFKYDTLGQRVAEINGEGGVTEFIYGTLGQVVCTVQYTNLSKAPLDAGSDWRPTASSTDRVSHFKYDKAGRQIAVVNGEGMVTEFTHNNAGQVTKTTRYANVIKNAGAPSADAEAWRPPTSNQDSHDYIRYDTAGRKTAEVNSLGAVSRLTYNTIGQLIQITRHAALQLWAPDDETAPDQAPSPTTADRTSHFKYDQAGRKIAEIDGAGAVTEFIHNTSGQVVRTIQYATASSAPTGNWRPSVSTSDRITYFKYDQSGRKIAEINGENAVTEFIYNTTGEITKTTRYALASSNPLTESAQWRPPQTTRDRTTYARYDRTGRKVEEVDAESAVTQFIHDAAGQLTAIIRRAQPANPQHLDTSAPLQPSRPSLNRDDRATWYVYDAAGQRAYTVDALGGVQHKRYNAQGHIIGVTEYGTRYHGPLDLASLNAFYAHHITELDRHTRLIHDKAGQLRFTIDALGGVVETVHDGLGRVARRIAYDTAIDPAALDDTATPEAARALLPRQVPNARETLYTYTATGQLLHTATSLKLDGSAKYFGITERRYDAYGQLTSTTAFSAMVNLSGLPAVVSSERLAATIQRSADDRTQSNKYDLSGRRVRSVDGEGYAEQFTYDTLGNQTHFTNKNGATFTYRHDLLGRQTSELSPELALARMTERFGVDITDGQVETRLHYNIWGELASRTEAAGRAEQRTTQYHYDATGRQTGVTYEAVGAYDAGRDNLLTNGADGSAVARTENLQALSSQTVYDVFGQAVIHRDVAGDYSYKTYDKLGRLVHEIDGNHRVTSHFYSEVVGEHAGLTRLDQAAKFSDSLSVRADQLNTAVAAVANGGTPRTMATYYDKLGRQATVLDQYSRKDFTGMAHRYHAATGRSGRWIGKTQFAYNVWGDLVSREALLEYGSSQYATTRHEYDLGGRLDREINAEGYVTRYRSNAFGEQDLVTQYAQAVDPTAERPADPQAIRPDTHPGSAIGFDRSVQYHYDRRGMKVRQTELALEVGDYRQEQPLPEEDPRAEIPRQPRPAPPIAEEPAPVPAPAPTPPGTSPSPDTIGIRDPRERTRFSAAPSQSSTPGLRVLIPLPRMALGWRSVNRVTHFSFDGLGHLTRSTQASHALNGDWLSDGESLIQQYDVLGRETRRHDAGGHTTTFDLDGLGQALRTTQDVLRGSDLSLLPMSQRRPQHTLRAFDRLGRLLQTQDATGAQTYFSYNARGDVAKEWSPYTEWTLGEGQPTRSAQRTASRNAIRLFTYDKAGRQTATDTLIQRARADAQVFSTESAIYNAFGEITQRQRDGTIYEENWYDVGGNRWKTSANGVSRITWFDLQGNATRSFTSTRRNLGNMNSPDGVMLGRYKPQHTTTYFDRLGRITRQDASSVAHDATAPTQLVNRQTLDAWGNVLMRERNGVARQRYRYNAQNQVVTETQLNTASLAANGTASIGDLTKTTYHDAWGRNIGSIDAAGNIQRATFNRAGQLVAEHHADGGQVQYTYDGFGRTRTKTDEVGRTFTYYYDEAGREIDRHVQHGETGKWLSQRRYDELGRKISETNADTADDHQTTLYWYDPRGLLVRSTRPLGQSTQYWYTNAGQKARQKDANGYSSTWDYNAAGQLISHTDLGAATYQYTYDLAGQLTRQTNSRGQKLYYDYMANGAIKEIKDAYRRSATRYDYDADGNRTRETFTNDGVVYRDITTSYDSQGRLTAARDDSGQKPYDLQIAYDAVGNRRRIWGTRASLRPDSVINSIITAWERMHGGLGSVDQWFTYDSMSRVLINAGAFSNGTISDINAAAVYSYDAAGRRRQETRKTLYQSDATGSDVFYTYDLSDRLIKQERRELTGVDFNRGETVTERESFYARDYQIDTTYVRFSTYGQAYRRDLSFTNFNANGQVESRQEKVEGLRTELSPASGLYLRSQQTFQYDAAGNLSQADITSYTSEKSDVAERASGVGPGYQSSVARYVYSYAVFDSYRESGQRLTGTAFERDGKATAFVPSTSLQHHDANGNLVQLDRGQDMTWYVTDTAGHTVSSWRSMGRPWRSGGTPNFIVITPADGEIRAGDLSQPMATMPLAASPALGARWSRETQLFLNDHHIGAVTESGSQALLPGWRGSSTDTSSQPTTVQTQVDLSGLKQTEPEQGNPQSYTVQAGDTARSLAQRFYGDQSLWYAIVEANGLPSSTAELPAGQVIKIPQRVRATNTADSHAVYQPSSIIGNTNPEVVLPPPPPKSKGCGVLGNIIVVVVAVVVTIYTAGAASAWLSSAAPSVFATTTAAGAAGTVTVANTAALVAGSTIGAVAGSVASQGLAIAMGLQDRFSWKQVGLAAIGGAIGGAMNATGALSNLHPAVQAATANIAAQGIGIVTGLQDGFDWRSVAVAAVAAGISSSLAPAARDAATKAFGSTFAGTTASRIVSGLVSQSVRMLVYRQGRIDYAAVAADAFGSALGDSLAEAMQPTQGEGPWSAADYRNGSDIESDNAAARGSYTGGRDFAADVQRRRELISVGLDPDEVGEVGDGAVRMSQRTIDPRRALALVEGRLSTRMATDTPAGVRSALEDAMRDLADPRFADALRGRYVLTSEQATSVGAMQQQYGAVRWGDDTYRRDLSAFSRGLSGLDDDAVRLHALTGIAQSLNPGYRIDGDVGIGRMPVLLARDTSVLGLPGRMLGGLEAFFNGPAGYGDDGSALFLNPRTHSYQGQEEIAFEAAALGMTPTPGPRGVGVARSGLAFGASASERLASTLARVEADSLRLPGAGDELLTLVSPQTGELVAQVLHAGGRGRPPESFLKTMEGSVFTHNHPSGASLGFEDVATALANGARQVRAVGDKNTYVLDISLPPASQSTARFNFATEVTMAQPEVQRSVVSSTPGFFGLPKTDRIAAFSNALTDYWTNLSARYPDNFRFTVSPTKR